MHPCQVWLYVHIPFTCGRFFLRTVAERGFAVVGGYKPQESPTFFESMVKTHPRVVIEFHTPILDTYRFGYDDGEWRRSDLCRTCCCTTLTHIEAPRTYAGRFFSYAGRRVPRPYDDVLSVQLAKQLRLSKEHLPSRLGDFNLVGRTSMCAALIDAMESPRRDPWNRSYHRSPRPYAVPNVSLAHDEYVYRTLKRRARRRC